MTDTVSETEVSFEVWQNGDMVAAADSLADAEHFMLVYGQDGPVEAKTAITTRFPGFNVVPAMLAASPQGEGSSADAHPPQPDALPGDLREKIAAIIVRKVLQEDYDDLVEGYLDEILMAADEIILLPAYQAVAQTYYDNLARAALTTGEGK